MPWRTGTNWWHGVAGEPAGPAALRRPVVTLWGRYGTFPSAVGQGVADVLGIPFHDEAILEDDILPIVEGRPSPNAELESFVAQLRAADDAPDPDEGVDHLLPVTPTALQRVVQVLGTEDNIRHVRRYGENGGVIVGRNATRILAGHPGVLHVKLTAPYSHRISQVEQRTGVAAATARERARIDEWIRSRASIVAYGWDPRFDDLFGLVLNIALWDADTTIEVIAAAARVAAARS